MSKTEKIYCITKDVCKYQKSIPDFVNIYICNKNTRCKYQFSERKREVVYNKTDKPKSKGKKQARQR